MAARALPWRSRRERLLALGRLWRLRLLGARRVLSMGPVHHVHLLLVKKEDKTMRHKMVLAMAGARCRSSAECKMQSEVVLLTSLNIVLLKNGVLNVVSIVQNQIFMLKRIIMKLSKCLPTHASRRSSECSCSRCYSSSSRFSSSPSRSPSGASPPFCCCLPPLLLPWLLRLLLHITHPLTHDW